jgi:hypothetical protein
VRTEDLVEAQQVVVDVEVDQPVRRVGDPVDAQLGSGGVDPGGHGVDVVDAPDHVGAVGHADQVRWRAPSIQSGQ